MVVRGEKRCSTCQRWKPFDRFSKCRGSKDGLQYRCRACANTYTAVNRVEKRAYDRAYSVVNRDQIRTRRVVRRRQP